MQKMNSSHTRRKHLIQHVLQRFIGGVLYAKESFGRFIKLLVFSALSGTVKEEIWNTNSESFL